MKNKGYEDCRTIPLTEGYLKLILIAVVLQPQKLFQLSVFIGVLDFFISTKVIVTVKYKRVHSLLSRDVPNLFKSDRVKG